MFPLVLCLICFTLIGSGSTTDFHNGNIPKSVDQTFHNKTEQDMTILVFSSHQSGLVRERNRRLKIFNPTYGNQSHLPDILLPCDHVRHVAGMLSNNTIIVAGGRPSFACHHRWLPRLESSTTKVHFIDLETNKIRLGPSMITGRNLAASAVIEDVFYVCGGYVRDSLSITLRSCERFISGQWESIAPMMEKRTDPAMAAHGGYLYVFGGYGHPRPYSSNCLKTTERYDPRSNAWQNMAPLNEGRCAMAAVVFNQSIIVCGGAVMQNPYLNICQKYNPALNEWSDLSSMNEKRRQFSLIVFNEVIYAIGGLFRDRTNLIEWYDCEADTWHLLNQTLDIPRFHTSAFVIKRDLV